jgi:hypothetical protein
MTGEDKEELESVSLTLEESIDYIEKTLQNAINKAVEHRVIEASALFFVLHKLARVYEAVFKYTIVEQRDIIEDKEGEFFDVVKQMSEEFADKMIKQLDELRK